MSWSLPKVETCGSREFLLWPLIALASTGGAFGDVWLPGGHGAVHTQMRSARLLHREGVNKDPPHSTEEQDHRYANILMVSLVVSLFMRY